ncbi:MAG: protein kinase, partial [Candidatus Krumholzibacteria bacterium]|nr:protein kinase [Candidatus Krumholzibacteria bacterium]
TPAYMAPEQVLGNRPVDARTDVYAVGCVAYWLITGQVVFTGKTAMEILTRHTHETPVPPSARTELEVPPALEEVVMACLSKNPDERPASADALAAALKSIATRTTWTTERAHEWWDLHKPVRGTA